MAISSKYVKDLAGSISKGGGKAINAYGDWTMNNPKSSLGISAAAIATGVLQGRDDENNNNLANTIGASGGMLLGGPAGAVAGLIAGKVLF